MLIREGDEAGDPDVQPYDVGTTAEIADVTPLAVRPLLPQQHRRPALPHQRHREPRAVSALRRRVSRRSARRPVGDRTAESPRSPVEFREYLEPDRRVLGKSDRRRRFPDDPVRASYAIGEALQVADALKQQLLELGSAEERLRRRARLSAPALAAIALAARAQERARTPGQQRRARAAASAPTKKNSSASTSATTKDSLAEWTPGLPTGGIPRAPRRRFGSDSVRWWHRAGGNYVKNPLDSLEGTVICGSSLRSCLYVIVKATEGVAITMIVEAWIAGLARWLHFFFGIMWIGLLYYFNFVQVASGRRMPTPTAPAAGDHQIRAAARAVVLPLGRGLDVDHGRDLARHVGRRHRVRQSVHVPSAVHRHRHRCVARHDHG